MNDCPSDAGQLEQNLQSIPPTLGQPGQALAECGYVDAELFQRLGEQRPELDLYVSVHREDAHAERRYDYRPLDQIKKPKAINDPVPQHRPPVLLVERLLHIPDAGELQPFAYWVGNVSSQIAC